MRWPIGRCGDIFLDMMDHWEAWCFIGNQVAHKKMRWLIGRHVGSLSDEITERKWGGEKYSVLCDIIIRLSYQEVTRNYHMLVFKGPWHEISTFNYFIKQHLLAL
jgi:hypothetical protein